MRIEPGWKVLKVADENSLCGAERLWGLRKVARAAARRGLPGVFVECGVFRGGSAVVIAEALQATNPSLEILLFDVFTGMPEPGSEDRVEAWADVGKFVSSEDTVRETFKKAGVSEARLRFVAGRYERTLAGYSPPPVAFLHVDCDGYESVRLVLRTFWDAVVPGGTVVFDDYGHWSGCRKAVDEFFSERGLRPELNAIDYTSHWLIKSAAAPAGGRSRPDVARRTDYVARSRQEQFIVPLLARAIERALERHAPEPGPGDRALDVGCGEQPLRSLVEKRGFVYVGLDTQQNASGTVDVVAPIDGPLTDSLRARLPFRLILCTEVLEHVADWDAAFANFRALLSPGGRGVLTCPQVYPLHEEPYDFWRPTDHALRYWAGRHGLAVVALERLGDGWDVLGTALAALKPASRVVAGAPLAALARLARRLAFAAVRSQLLRRALEDRGPLYLANLAVIEKPATP